MDVASELSIGALATAVEIPVNTIRTWERRYGFPEAIRRPSGHRRYPTEAVAKLKLVKKLLNLGFKASDVLSASEDELLRQLDAVTGRAVPPPGFIADDSLFTTWFAALRRFDAGALHRDIQHDCARLGTLAFLDQRLAPFLTEVGRRWRAGRLDIGEEHLASQVIQTFLSSLWTSIPPEAASPVVVCATLPGESHAIGLHMAAAALSLAGWDVRFLGPDTPPEVIAQTARECQAQAIAIGSSFAADPTTTSQAVRALRAAVGPQITLWVGGGGHGFADDANTPTSMSDLFERSRHIRRPR